MSNIWLQGVGAEPGPTNYSRTIDQARPLSDFADHLTEEQVRQVEEAYPNGRARIWGLRRGQTSDNRKNWERLPIGATVLFCWSALYRSAAEVRLKLESEELGRHLWESRDDGEGFPYLYFVGELTPLEIPAPEFNRAVGYKEKSNPRTLVRMRDDAALRAAEFLDETLPTENVEEYEEEEFEEAVAGLEEIGELDTDRQSKQRTEQRYIRQHWFGGRDRAQCGLCGREFPVRLLVAAHIKKRALCSREEKLDYRNNTMPMCSLGCDELFERGYLGVVDGVVTVHPDRPATEAVDRYLERVAGRKTPIWTDDSAPYFRSHQRLHGFEQSSGESHTEV